VTAPARLEIYESRIRKLSAEVEALGARSARIGNFRGLAFLAGVGSVIWGAAGSGGNISLITGVAGIAAFVWLVRQHGLLSAEEDYAARLLAVNERARLRVSGGGSQLPDDGAELAAELAEAAGDAGEAQRIRTLSDDLDLFGRASLFQRLNVAHTRFGRRALAEALLSGLEPERVLRRQAAALALSPELELRQRVEALASALTRRKAGQSVAAALDPEPLLSWAEGAPKLLPRAFLLWSARLLTLVNIAVVLLVWLQLAPGVVMLAPLALSLLVLLATRAEAQSAFAAVATREGALSGYDRLLEAIETSQVDAELLQELRARLRSGDATPSRAMGELRSAVSYFELRYNGLIYPFANLFLLWDVHCTARVEQWQMRYGKAARDWFRVLGEFESLSALAGLAHDEPDFCFPRLVAEPRFSARGLSHPLIPPGKRVGNDLDLPGPSSALLVTGSNMSGKSTLLRSVGLACVMAYAGGPVSASSLELGNLRLATSLRVRDSLEQGVSHFYAELQKLKAVLDGSGGAVPVLFLLDEILHGTNSRERQIGARWLLSELLQRGALGAVSTHDMALCELAPELMQHVRLVHLREDVVGGEMTFDYRLREGPVQAGNALRLMRRVGLRVPDSA
jgi:hypothetical protein